MNSIHSNRNWLLIRANICPDVAKVAQYIDHWGDAVEFNDITGEELILLAEVYRKWKDNSKVTFDPRVEGYVKRGFYQQVQQAKVLRGVSEKTTDLGLKFAHVTYTLDRNTKDSDTSMMLGMPPKFLVDSVAFCRFPEMLADLNWTFEERIRNMMRFTSPSNNTLSIYRSVNSHWTDRMHGGLIDEFLTGNRLVAMTLELLGQLKKHEQSINWNYLLHAMILVVEIQKTQCIEQLESMCKAYFVTSTLQKVYGLLSEIRSDLSFNELFESNVEAKLYSSYIDYMTDPTVLNKVSYHKARYNAINQLSAQEVSPYSYVIATRKSRKLAAHGCD